MNFLSTHIDHFIFGLLGFMSFISLTLTIERALFYKNVNAKTYESLDELEIDLTKNLTSLSVIGTNAPYVGLLGTVVGIIITFYNMSKSGNFDTATIMGGLSLALKATALGLVVAIPTLIAYSFFLRMSDRNIAIWKRKMHLDRNDKLNVIPLIDVMLVLLAITLTAASFITYGKVEVSLPSSKTSSKEFPQERMEIVINQKNELFYNGNSVDITSLKETLSTLKKDDFILFKGDKIAHFGTFISILEILKELGLSNFVIMTEVRNES